MPRYVNKPFIIIIIIIMMKTLLNGYLAYIYNCKSHLYQVIYNWLLKSLIIYTKNILLR